MEFNFNELSKKYTLFLYQLNEVELGELAFYENLSYTSALTEIGEISFTMRSHYSDEQGVLRETPYYHELAADKLVLIDGKEFYFIDTCSENASDGQYTKEVHAYRREYELSLKAFNDYEPETERLLYFKYPTGPATSDGFPWKTRTALEADPSIGFIFKDTTSSDPNIMEDGYHFGIFNEIEKLTSWRLERSGGFPKIPKIRNPEPGKQQAANDIDLSKQARMITTSEANILEVLKQIQESWNCYFEYDTVNRIIRIKTLDDLLFEENREERKAKGLMSDENFILDLTRDLKTEEVKTRLHLYNIDGVGVTAEMMAHGGPYLENYSYFKDTKYMSIDLMSALNLYETNLKEQTSLVRVYWTEVKTLLQERKETEGLINQAELDLTSPVVDLDYYETLKTGYKDADGVVITEPRKLDAEEQKEYNRIKKVVRDLNNKINNYRTGTYTKKPRSLKTIDALKKTSMNKLRALQNKSLMGAIFGSYETMTFGKKTGQLMKEMEPYIRDATYQSDSISEASELYTLGQNLLKEVSRPTVQFSLSVFDFLTLTEFSEAWGWLELGDIIEIRNQQLDFVNNVMLLKVIHEPESQSLTLEFSTDLKLKDDTKFIAELIANSSTIASQVAFNSNYWANGGAAGGAIGEGGLGNVFDKLYANFIQTKTLMADEIFANNAEIGNLVAESITADTIITDAISANLAKIDFAEIDSANIAKLVAETAFVDTLTANEAFVDTLTANEAFIESLVAQTVFADTLSANSIFTSKLAADTGFIGSLTSQVAFINSLAANEAFIDEINSKIVVSETVLAEYVKTATLEANYATIANLTAATARIETLEANTITTEYLTANYATITNLAAEKARIDALESSAITTTYLDATYATIQSLNAAEAKIGTLETNAITTQIIEAAEGYFDTILSNKIKTSSLVTGALNANYIQAGFINASVADIDQLVSDTIKTGILTASYIESNYISADALKVGSGSFDSVLTDYLLAKNGFLSNLQVEGAQIVNLSANQITAGTLSAERLLISDPLNPEKGLLFTLNNLGELVSTSVDSLDATLLTPRTLTADKLVAETITANEIAADAILATHIKAGEILARHIKAGEIEAVHIAAGTITADSGIIDSLDATKLTTGRVESNVNNFYLDLQTGYFNLGDRFINDALGLRIVAANGKNYENYIEERIPHKIETFPKQILLSTSNVGEVETTQQFPISIGVFDGAYLKAASISGVYLKNLAGQIVSPLGFGATTTNSIDGGYAQITATFSSEIVLPDDTGSLGFTVLLTETLQEYPFEISWTKIKDPAKLFRVEIISSNGDTFKNNLISTILKAYVYEDNIDITGSIDASRFIWTKTKADGTLDDQWNALYADGAKEVPVTASDISERATFNCSIL